MKWIKEWAFVVGWVVALAFTQACNPPTAPDINVFNQNTATNNNSGGGGNGASPSPGTGGDLPAGSTVRVGLFGQSCPAGTTAPSNGSRSIIKGCVGFMTATPKDPNGTDIPAAIHGPSCAWRSDGSIDLSPAENAFNQDARCPDVGSSTVTATVKNVVGNVGIECLLGTGARTFGPPVFFWYEGDDLPAAPRLAEMRRDAIVRALDAYEAEAQ